jgi:hypothetical protein
MGRFSGATLAEESFRRWDNQIKEKRNQYWRAITEARQEYLTEHKFVYDKTVRPALHYWMQNKYGIKMGMDGQGNYTQDYEVVEPKRFLMFQIKFLK